MTAGIPNEYSGSGLLSKLICIMIAGIPWMLLLYIIT